MNVEGHEVIVVGAAQGTDHPAEARGVGPRAVDEHDRWRVSGRHHVNLLPSIAVARPARQGQRLAMEGLALAACVHPDERQVEAVARAVCEIPPRGCRTARSSISCFRVC
jgi:hypothetical protein